MSLIVALGILRANVALAASSANVTPQLTPQPTPQPTNSAAIPALDLPTDGCDCSGDLYDCSSFPLWSAAQACFNRCRIRAGFDIHGLDEDGDSVACELPLPISPFSVTLTVTLTATTPITPTGQITGAGPLPSASATQILSPTVVSPTERITIENVPAGQAVETEASPGPPAGGDAVAQPPAALNPPAQAPPGTFLVPLPVIILVATSSLMLVAMLGVLVWLLRRQVGQRKPSSRGAKDPPSPDAN